jgi:hypothetical protein
LILDLEENTMKNKAKLDNVIADAIQLIKNPIAFYKNMPKTGGFSDPIIFLLVMSVVAGIIIALLSLVGFGMGQSMGAAGFSVVFFLPVMAIIGSFISAGIIYVIWKLMGSNESYNSAYRCVAYASVLYPMIAVVSVIPYIGTMVGVAWGIYLMIIASTEVHGLNKRSVWIVFGILGLLMLFFNISGEIASRQMSSQLENMSKDFTGFGKQLEKLGNNDDMTPEQAGKALGEFLKGLEQATSKD